MGLKIQRLHYRHQRWRDADRPGTDEIETDWLYPITWKIVAPVGIAVAIATAGGAYYLWQNWSNLQEDFPNLRSYSDSVFGEIGDEKSYQDLERN